MIVNMHQAKSQLSKLVERARQGEDAVIAKDGEPVARLVPVVTARRERQIGLLAGMATVPDDFNEPLPDGYDRTS